MAHRFRRTCTAASHPHRRPPQTTARTPAEPAAPPCPAAVLIGAHAVRTSRCGCGGRASASRRHTAPTGSTARCGAGAVRRPGRCARGRCARGSPASARRGEITSPRVPLGCPPRGQRVPPPVLAEQPQRRSRTCERVPWKPCRQAQRVIIDGGRRLLRPGAPLRSRLLWAPPSGNGALAGALHFPWTTLASEGRFPWTRLASVQMITLRYADTPGVRPTSGMPTAGTHRSDDYSPCSTW